jgi:DNA-binding CsgD family transcriptional regulator
MKTGSIYIIRNTVNDKVYIGQTTMAVKERFYAHTKPSTSKRKPGYKLYSAMNKYGKDKFYCETLETGIPIYQLDEKEIAYIAKYDSFKHGYNSTPGGDGRVFNKLSNEDEVLALAKSGKSTQEIAEMFFVNKATVIRTLHKLGFYYHTDPDKVLELSEAGKSNKEIAKILGCSAATVSRILDRKNKRKHRNPIKNRDCFDYNALIADYYAQMPMKELCDKYGITKTTFYRLKAKIGFRTRPQIYKHKIRYFYNDARCNDYGESPSRLDDELPAEAHCTPKG